MAVQWAQESCDRRDDPLSGGRIIQLTSAAAISNNIYGEQPYCSADGKRVVIARCQDFCFDQYGSLLVHELDTLRIAMVVPRMIGVRGIFNAAWSGMIHYWTPKRQLMRLSLETLKQEKVYVEKDPKAPILGGSVSPDQRYVIGIGWRLKGRGSPVYQIIRLDLKKKKRQVIFEHPEICNSHLQFNPIHGKQILVQNNRGLRLKKDGTIDRYTHTAAGTTLFVIDSDGSNQRYVPVGPPVTSTCTGHECFVGDTGKVVFTVGWDAPDSYDSKLDSRYPEGNLFTAAPGDERPTVFVAPEHRFNHVCASRCGKYFVADSFNGGLFKDGQLQAMMLVVGNFATGKHRVLVQDTQASGGGNQCTHTHPYFTADNRHVIYNADPYYGVPQVFAAKIPDGFLAGLD